ncbi:hypothetical protein P5V15_013845 [Pogonomyrmex californicus]
MIPGIFIGCCLVEPQNYTCPISISNITEEEKIVQVPQVTLEKIDIQEKITQKSVNAIQTKNRNIKLISREEQINKSLRTEHLNKEEQKSVLELCHEYNDVFHLGDTLTCTKIKHEVTVQTDSSPVNVRPYCLPEKHKDKVNK